MLYIIGTPIGNKGDITLRALETLKILDLIYCEDTRSTAKLLDLLGIKIPLKRADSNILERISMEIIEKARFQNIGFVTDAGMPAISDPGTVLIAQCHRHNLPFQIVPGVSSLDTAVTGCGFPAQPMLFLGFLPRKSGRKTLLGSFKDLEKTIIFFESPNRIRKTLKELYDVIGERWICICRELTKMHEEFIRVRLSEAVSLKFMEKGEFVVVLAPAGWYEPQSKN